MLKFIQKLIQIIYYQRVYGRFQNYTMVPRSVYIQNLKICNQFKNLQGIVVECGTWKGGMIAGIANTLGPNKIYYLYDSFEGLPQAKEIDGVAAIKWQYDINSPKYFNNCKADLETAIKTMKMAGIKNFKIFPGWFSETLLNYDKEPISILRLDADWYESTYQCLEKLYPYVIRGGVIIVDDYYTWEGCSKAVHEYFFKNGIGLPIRQYNNNVCYIIKD